MRLSIYFFGLQDLESRELEEMLTSLAEIDDLSVNLSRDRIRPGEIYASAEFAHYMVELAKPLIEGALKEVGRDLYLGSKERIHRRLTDWTRARNLESQRERIRFTLSESGEMMVVASDRVSDNPN